MPPRPWRSRSALAAALAPPVEEVSTPQDGRWIVPATHIPARCWGGEGTVASVVRRPPPPLRGPPPRNHGGGKSVRRSLLLTTLPVPCVGVGSFTHADRR